MSPDALKPVVGPRGVTLALNWDELLAPNPKENGEELYKVFFLRCFDGCSGC